MSSNIPEFTDLSNAMKSQINEVEAAESYTNAPEKVITRKKRNWCARNCCAVIDLNDRIFRIWQYTMVMAQIVSSFLQMYMATFASLQLAMWKTVFVIDIVLLLDIMMKANHAYKDRRGVLVKSRKRIFLRYLKSDLLLDVMCIAPTDFIGFVLPTLDPFIFISKLRLNRCINLIRITAFFEERENELGSRTSLLRTLKYSVICVICTHAVTCLWITVACYGLHSWGATMSCYDNTWVFNDLVGFNLTYNTEPTDSYITSLYWALATCTSTGYGDIYAVRIVERWVSIIAMLVGITIYFGMLFGGLTSMMTNFDYKQSAFVHRLNMIKDHMIKHEVPEDLQSSVTNYYDYLWVRKQGHLDDKIYDNLPWTFRADIMHSFTGNIIEKAAVFSKSSIGFKRMMSIYMKPQLCLPQQIIVTRGDTSQRMFYILRGEVEVLSENDDRTPIAILKKGRLFGEVNLIYSMPRTATVRAKTHCDLMVLHRDDLMTVLKYYPEVEEHMNAVAKERCKMAEKTIKFRDERQDEYKAFQSRDYSFIEPTVHAHRRSFAYDSSSGQTNEQLKLTSSVDAIKAGRGEEDVEDAEEQTTKGIVSCLKNLQTFFNTSKTIRANGPVEKGWRFTMMTATILILIIYPYFASFTSPDSRHGYFDSGFGQFMLIFTYLLDLILLFDIVMTFRTQVETPFGPMKRKRDIAKHYLCSITFYLDVLAIIPFEIACIPLAAGAYKKKMFALARLNRFLKVHKVSKMFDWMEQILENNITVVRSVKFLLYIFLLQHWCGCCFFAMVCWNGGCQENSWLVYWTDNNGVETTNPGSEYVLSVYWATVTMTSTGYGDISAHTRIGRVVALLFMVVGLLLYGFLLSAMASTLTNLLAPLVHYQEHLVDIEEFMVDRKLSKKLQSHVISYLANLWEKHKGVWTPGQELMIHDAPAALQQDVALEDVFETLNVCPLFRNTEEPFLRALATKVQTYLFCPGESIIYAGDTGSDMYLVKQGKCEVMSADMQTQLAELEAGDYFGEIGMLFGDYREANLRAMTHVEVLEVKMEEIESLFPDFPLIEAQFDEIRGQRELLNHLKEVKGREIGEDLLCSTPSKHTCDRNDSKFKSATALAREESVDGLFYRPSRILGPYIDFRSIEEGTDEEREYLEVFDELGPAGKFFSKILLRRTLSPDGLYVKILAAVMVVCAVIQTFLIPLQFSFLPGNIGLMVFLYLIDLISFTNIYISLHISFYNEDGILVTHPVCTARNYIKTNFFMDIISCIPFEILLLCVGMEEFEKLIPLFALLRINRLLNMHWMWMLFGYIESGVKNFRNTEPVRALKIVIYILIFIHVMACILYLVASPPDTSGTLEVGELAIRENAWIKKVIGNNNISLSQDTPKFQLYAICIYWATATTVSVGYGDISARYVYEMIIAIVVMICGVLFFGYIIASVAASLTNSNVARTLFKEKLEQIELFLTDHHLKPDLIQRVVAHYNYMWLRTKGKDPDDLFAGLPLSLYGDVTLGLYRDSIRKISLFKHTEESFIKMLSRRIRPLIFLKGEYIVKKYDLGHEMFFINRGAVNVISEDEQTIFDTYNQGDSFGEVALLFNCARTASVVAKVNSDIFVLSKEDLDDCLKSYPHIQEQIRETAKQRLKYARQRSLTRLQTSQPEKFDDSVHTCPWPTPSADKLAPTEEVDWNPQREVLSQMDIEEPGQQTQRGCCAECLRFTFRPLNRLWRLFQNIECLFGIMSAWLVIYQFAFQDHNNTVIGLNYFCDVFFLLEIYLRFHLTFHNEQGDLIDDFDSVYDHYLKDIWEFPIDIAAMLPLDVFALAASPGQKMTVLSTLRLVRILRLKRTIGHFNKWEREMDVNMFVMKLLQNCAILGILMHSFSGIWHLLACPLYADCKPSSWMTFSDTGTGSSMDRYCTCLYWCVATMTSTGYGDIHAYTILEMFFASVVMISGKLVFGFILGNIASTLSTREANKVQYDFKIIAMKKSMTDQGVPNNLQVRVVDYLNHLWFRHAGKDVSNLFHEASTCLEAEVATAVTHQMILNIKLFEGAEASFLRQVALRVREVLFLPGDLILKKDDMGLEVLYIERGEAEVLTEDDPPEVIDYLHEGTLLGEVSLVANLPRRVTVRADTHCDVFSLSKKDLDEVLELYPLMKEFVTAVGNKRFGNILSQMK